jgi:pimeloyl-ACP methyl ester carboxylesterase
MKEAEIGPFIQEQWLDVDGLRLHCFVAGESGSPMVLLHGGGLDSASISWRACIGPLSTQHRVFAPDLPGYGESDRPKVEYTLEYYVNFLEHLLDALHLQKVSLAGISLGGGIALSFTLRFPDRVDKLILVDSYGLQSRVAWHKLSYLLVRLPFINALTMRLLGSSRNLIRWSLLAGLVYSPQRLSEELVDEVYLRARETGAGKAFNTFQKSEALWNGLRSDLSGRLHEITVPTLIVQGAEDPAVPMADVRRARALIKNSELYIVPQTKHWPQGEKPDEFTRVALKFLGG